MFSELAQIAKKEQRDASKTPVYNKPLAPVLQKTPEYKKIDELHKYEREIIKILLLYGNNNVEFEGYVPGEEVDDNEVKSLKKYQFENVVSKEVYLNLQEDEVEFTDEIFQLIYYEVIHQLNQDTTISVDAFINNEDARIASLVTNILMDDEKYVLSDWERKKVFPKTKKDDLAKMVLDAIYNLRRVLIEQKIKSLISEIDKENINDQILESVVNYTNLKQKLYQRLNRVI